MTPFFCAKARLHVTLVIFPSEHRQPLASHRIQASMFKPITCRVALTFLFVRYSLFLPQERVNTRQKKVLGRKSDRHPLF